MPETTTPVLLALSFSLSIQFAAAETQWQGFCSDVPSAGFAQAYPRLDELPGLREWIGSRSIHELGSTAFEITNKQFEGTIRIPRKDIKFDRYGIYTPVAQMLGNRAGEMPDLLAFGLLAQGESLKAYDGNGFFGTHLNHTQAGAAMMSQHRPDGTPYGIKPNMLYHPPTLTSAARTLLVSELVNMTSNPWKGTAGPMESQWLS